MLNRIKSLFLMVFGALSLLASFAALSANSAAYAVPTDDEKEIATVCFENEDRIYIHCTEGTIDCDPRGC